MRVTDDREQYSRMQGDLKAQLDERDCFLMQRRQTEISRERELLQSILEPFLTHKWELDQELARLRRDFEVLKGSLAANAELEREVARLRSDLAAVRVKECPEPETYIPSTPRRLVTEKPSVSTALVRNQETLPETGTNQTPPPATTASTRVEPPASRLAEPRPWDVVPRWTSAQAQGATTRAVNKRASFDMALSRPFQHHERARVVVEHIACVYENGRVSPSFPMENVLIQYRPKAGAEMPHFSAGRMYLARYAETFVCVGVPTERFYSMIAMVGAFLKRAKPGYDLDLTSIVAHRDASVTWVFMNVDENTTVRRYNNKEDLVPLLNRHRRHLVVDSTITLSISTSTELRRSCKLKITLATAQMVDFAGPHAGEGPQWEPDLSLLMELDFAKELLDENTKATMAREKQRAFSDTGR